MEFMQHGILLEPKQPDEIDEVNSTADSRPAYV